METKVAGIALESNAQLQSGSNDTGKVRLLPQHKRNGRFTTALITHGFARDNSLFAASRTDRYLVKRSNQRFAAMDSLVEDFDREVAHVSTIQHELLRLQSLMALRALEVFSARVMQQAIRSWVARHKLVMLKLSRFIYDRIYFLRYYKLRVKAACKLALRMLIFLAKKLLKTHRRRKEAAIRIQKLYHKWRLLHTIQYRITVLGKVSVLLKLYSLFGKCRAIMHMRRAEVQRVQDEEQAQYTELLALEQQRQAEDAIRTAEEVKRQLEEANRKARAKMIAAAKKQAKAALLASATAPRGTKNKASKGQSITAIDAIDLDAQVPAVPDGGAVHHGGAAPHDGHPAAATGHTPEKEKEKIDYYTAPVSTTAILKAVSAGITTGSSSSQVMHSLVYNRYGSVYGGMYGEYCCVGDNRVRSFAAVRFRFMLRCFRKKRVKALNGPQAKNFFYQLSHLHNTPHERNPNLVVKFLQGLIRTYAVKRGSKGSGSGDTSTTGSGGIGKMLLSSFRRTKLNSSMSLECTSDDSSSKNNDGFMCSPETSNKEVPLSPSKDRVFASPTRILGVPFRDTTEEPSSTFVTQKPFGASSAVVQGTSTHQQEATSPVSNQAPLTQRSIVQPHRDSRVATYPTYTTETFPTCFVTGSYRPRTLAELVLIILDMKRAVLKTPSLVDDNAPPLPSKASAKMNQRGMAAMNAMLRTGSTKHKNASAASKGAGDGSSSAAAHSTSSAAATAANANALPKADGPPPLLRGDSGINRAAKLKAAASAVNAQAPSAAPSATTASASLFQAAATGATTTSKGSPNSKIAPKNASTPEHIASSDASLSSTGKESAVRHSEVVPLASTVKSGSFKGKLVPSAPAPLVKQNSGAGSGLTAGQPSISAVSGNGVVEGAGANIPAQLRAQSRILRPSVIVTTPSPVPAPYITGPSTATTTSSKSGTQEGAQDTRDALKTSANIQSITPSAIIAAAKATLRDAEVVTSAPPEAVRRQSLGHGVQLSALGVLEGSRKTPTARTPNNQVERDDGGLGSAE